MIQFTLSLDEANDTILALVDASDAAFRREHYLTSAAMLRLAAKVASAAGDDERASTYLTAADDVECDPILPASA